MLDFIFLVCFDGADTPVGGWRLLPLYICWNGLSAMDLIVIVSKSSTGWMDSVWSFVQYLFPELLKFSVRTTCLSSVRPLSTLTARWDGWSSRLFRVWATWCSTSLFFAHDPCDEPTRIVPINVGFTCSQWTIWLSSNCRMEPNDIRHLTSSRLW